MFSGHLSTLRRTFLERPPRPWTLGMRSCRSITQRAGVEVILVVDVRQPSRVEER